ncbi:hypothetical protein FOQG_17593 [Fusarium oxysporum f. sp. raphani 54005]|uniref:Uncharacterized protein n=1 Tax=Fusarium oxysporum f. sp. raphani 54005 TaxID=1089458 RepID=X0BGZ4_FUSOX|nr:hypothetical protein FOQG_17593 [Fusarium oxysporum f. sp. raphani 54005]
MKNQYIRSKILLSKYQQMLLSEDGESRGTIDWLSFKCLKNYNSSL